MSLRRESDDTSHYTDFDMYQETVKRFTRSSLSPEEDRFSSKSKSSLKSSNSSSKSKDTRRCSFDLYEEATGRRRKSYEQGAVLTADTENFIIGQKVYVGGLRPGQIAYIGETHFAPGEWAGIVLDEPNGKNDGCVAGKRYFQCEPKKGIFSRLTRLTLEPLAIKESSPSNRQTPDRSRTVSPSASIRSAYQRSPGKNSMMTGDRVIVSSGFGSRPGILKYIGETQFASGTWCGIELDEGSGKNDGSVDGIRYFECEPKYGVFVPIAKVSLSPSTKKSRLSRAGSRESLVSNMTMNSVATTNTSRLRLSSAQKKPITPKPVSAPKSSFSMQDVIREKTNHIEQLMIERDLDREDGQYQALQFQKNISELKNRISELENKLSDEKKKSEELQFSVDEARFCGDELDAQSQVYKEQIKDLENKIITGSASGTGSLEGSSLDIINAKLKETSESYEAKLSNFHAQEKSLQANIQRLLAQNEALQKELLSKDETVSNYEAKIRDLQSVQQELIVRSATHGNQNALSNDLLQQDIAKQDDKILQMSNEIKELTKNLEEAKKTGELEALKTEYEAMKRTLKEYETNSTDQLEEQKSETTKKDLLIVELKDEISQLSNELTKHSERLSSLQEELSKSNKTNEDKEEALTDSRSLAEVEKEKSLVLESKVQNLEGVLSELSSNHEKAVSETVELRNELKLLEADNKQNKEDNLLKMAEISELAQKLESEVKKNESLLETLSQTEVVGKTKAVELSSAVESKSAEIQVLQNGLKTAQEENVTIKQALLKSKESYKEKTNEVNTLMEKISKLEEENSLKIEKLQALLKTAEDEKTAKENLLSEKLFEITALKVEVEEESKKAERLSESLSNMESVNKSEAGELAKEVAAKTSEIKNLNDNLEKARNKALERENKIAEFEKCLQEKLAEVDDLNKRIEGISKNYDSEIAVLKSSDDEKSSQLEILKSDLQKLNEHKASADIKTRDLEVMLTTKEFEIEKLSESLKEETQKLKESSQKQSTQLEDISKLNETINLQTNALTELNSKYEKSNQEMVKEISEKDALTVKLTETAEKLSKKELEYSDVCRKNEALNAKCATLVEQTETLQKDLNNLRSSSTDSGAELIKISEELTIKQKSYQELLDKSTEEQIQLQNQLQEAEQKMNLLNEDISLLKGQLSTMNAQHAEDEISLQEAKNNYEKALAETKSIYEAEKLSIKTQLENQLEATENNKVSLDESIGKLQLQIKLLQDEMENSKTLYKNKESDLMNELKSKSDAELKLNLEIVQLKKEFSEKNLLNEDFENKLKTTSEEKAEFHAQLQNLKAKENQLQTEKLKLQKSIEQIQEDSIKAQTEIEQEKSTLISNIQELNNEVAEKNVIIEKIQINYNQLQLEFETSSRKLADFEGKLKSSEEALLNAKKVIEDGSSNLEEQSKKVDEMQNYIKETETANYELADEVTKLNVALRALEQQNSEVSSNFELFEMESDKKLNELNEKIQSYEAECNSLKTDTSSKADQISNLSAELSSVRQSFEDLNLKFDESSKEIKQLKEEHENVLKKYNLLEVEVSEKSSKITELAREVLVLNESAGVKVDESSKQIKELLEKNVAYAKEFENSKKDIEKKELLISELSALNENLTANINEKCGEIGEITMKNTAYSEECEKLNIIIAKKDLNITELSSELHSVKENTGVKFSESSKKLTEIQKKNAELLLTNEDLAMKLEETRIHLEKKSLEIKSISEDNDVMKQIMQSEEEVQGQLGVYQSIAEEHNTKCSEIKKSLEKKEEKMKKLEKELLETKMKIQTLEKEESLRKIKNNNDYMKSDDAEDSDVNSLAQINFLNSIIAEMQKTNESLKAKVEALEAVPLDFTRSSVFDVITKRKPAPRLFCDICDEFDLHETEDCPRQSSDSPVPPAELPNQNGKKEKKLPEPRKYCETCEVFGHEAGECPDDEYY